MKRLAALIALSILLATAAASAAVSTPEEFLGYRAGVRFTPHDRMLAYFYALAEKSDLLTVHEYGETYEGRPLVYLALRR